MQAVTDGTHSIQTDTLFIQKKKNSQGTEYYNADEITDPAHNARSVPPQNSSMNSISPTIQNVNDPPVAGLRLTTEGEKMGGVTAEPLRMDGRGATIEENRMEAGRYAGEQPENQVLSRGEPQSTNSRREESLSGFLEREHQEGRTAREVGGIGYGYRSISVSEQTAECAEVLKAIRSLGVECFAYSDDLRANVKGLTVSAKGEASTLRDGTVAVRNQEGIGISPQNIAAHEAFHAWGRTASPEALEYQSTVMRELLPDSERFNAYAGGIVDAYFQSGLDMQKDSHKKKFMDELCAYISGDLGENTVDISGMFADFNAVKSAWDKMLESGRNRAAPFEQARDPQPQPQRGSGAMDTLMIHPHGDMGDYSAAASLRGQEQGWRDTRRAVQQAESRLDPTKAEKLFAKGIAAGDYAEADIPASMSRGTVLELADYYYADASYNGPSGIKQRKTDIREQTEELAEQKKPPGVRRSSVFPQEKP